MPKKEKKKQFLKPVFLKVRDYNGSPSNDFILVLNCNPTGDCGKQGYYFNYFTNGNLKPLK